MKKDTILAILIFVVCSVNGCRSKSKNTDTQINRLTKLEFTQRIVDFGKVPSDTLLVAEYNFLNAGNHNLEIEYINPDCTCTDYKLSSRQVAPKQQGTIQLVFNTKDRIGQQEIFAIVKANTEDRFYRLLLKADVEYSEAE
ncbi:MAG: DUF1573 domain-containing protein [Mariniphaga sp.]|nr:DUF1573 domain-containing protein [Mariniphaga sp.]